MSISKIKVGSTNHTLIAANGVHYVAGSTSTAAGTWEGTNADITEYYDGLVVAFDVGVAGVSGGTTLNINGLGAVKVVRNASSAVTTHYGVGSVILLVYSDSGGTAFWKVADYDSDTKTRSSNKTGSKMFIIGATTQSTSGQTTYSNSNCYIGTDNCLYSGGAKVVTSLSGLGVTATAAELNKLDGVTATATELNYCDGVTSNIQTQLNGKAASSHDHTSITNAQIDALF